MDGSYRIFGGLPECALFLWRRSSDRRQSREDYDSEIILKIGRSTATGF